MTATAAPWRTPLTALFGVRYPVLAGGLMWLSDAPYVAALVRAGAMGFMTPRSFDSLAVFRQELRRCRELCQGLPFGVNLTLSNRMEANHEVPAQVGVAIEEGVRHFETVGPSPGVLFERIHAAGGVVIHKCAFVEHARKAEAAGADAVALVGMEAGGHPGMNELPTSVLCALALETLQVPVVWGGGIGHGRQIAAALAMGCAGVVIGTRFLVGDEVGAHPDYKDHLAGQPAQASTVVLRSTGNPWRVLDNGTAREVRRREDAGARTYPEFGALALGRTGRDGAYRGGDIDEGLLSMGPAIGFARRREPLQAIVDGLMTEAAQVLAKVRQLVPAGTHA
ncbi:nitronate monooxygenase [Caenimonas sedimenti]|uniref:Nitronate monooxygenase n=1 Tax=Caenimonas sedimenti TaxID=2596921 RepID=A0A562ZJH9_9BURK|nr:nitronate monooxygenase [Caenimonas sedimenti]TWO68475.1 nitronate monooxygenase [Caenimonas sedimenti]